MAHFAYQIGAHDIATPATSMYLAHPPSPPSQPALLEADDLHVERHSFVIRDACICPVLAHIRELMSQTHLTRVDQVPKPRISERMAHCAPSLI